MRAKRTIYQCGGGEIVSVDEVEVETIELVYGPHDGRILDFVNVLDDEVVIPGNITCVYRRDGVGKFTFNHYRDGLEA
jgi:hypothetical protein